MQYTLNGTWLSSPRAAEMLGISPEALRTRRWREGSRHPHHIRVGNGSVLYDRAAVERYATECKRELVA